MRVTTQMLNEAAMKAGLPIHRSTLLDYLDSNKGAGALNDVLQSKASASLNHTNKSKYEKIEKTADKLNKQAELFADSEKNGIFDKAKENNDTSDICKNVEDLVNNYNDLLDNMKKDSSALNLFYCQGLNDIIEENKEDLKEIGISVKGDGHLVIDKDKLKAASCDSLEKVLGGKDSFTQKLAFVSSRISDNAYANIQNISNNYTSNANTIENYLSKFNFYG